MKLSELPEGTIVEVSYAQGESARYELVTDPMDNPYCDMDYITRDALETIDDTRVTIISVPYEVTLKLAEWLDNVYTKSGTPESLIVEAAVETKKTKHDAHISNRPKMRD